MGQPARALALAGAVLAIASAAGCATGSPRPAAAGLRDAAAGAAARSTPVAATTPPASSPAATSPVPAVTATTAPPPPVTPCTGNTSAQLVVVDIAAQQAWMCSGAAVAHAAAVTTGASAQGMDTPTGTYHLNAKRTDQYLYPLGGGRYFVHYWLPYDANLYGFHDATWQQFPEGSPQYRTDGSHGCVHLALADMQWLYDWAQVGATITIR